MVGGGDTFYRDLVKGDSYFASKMKDNKNTFVSGGNNHGADRGWVRSQALMEVKGQGPEGRWEREGPPLFSLFLPSLD